MIEVVPLLVDSRMFVEWYDSLIVMVQLMMHDWMMIRKMSDLTRCDMLMVCWIDFVSALRRKKIGLRSCEGKMMM